MPSILFIEVLPDGSERLYSDANATFFADEGTASTTDGGDDFHKWVYRAPKEDGDPAAYTPIVPAQALVKIVADNGDVLHEESIVLPTVKNPTSRASVAGFLCPVNPAAVKGTPFEAANAEYATLPKTQVATFGDCVGTPCTAKLTFRRPRRSGPTRARAGAGNLHCYKLHRASVWLR